MELLLFWLSSVTANSFFCWLGSRWLGLGVGFVTVRNVGVHWLMLLLRDGKTMPSVHLESPLISSLKSS